MHLALTTMIDRLDSSELLDADVIRWGCPVPSFGDLSVSYVATVGLNPSNREFVDEYGTELDGKVRRFHTLKSLRLKSWMDVDAQHLRLILESCRNYFLDNPYDRWFNVLDRVVFGTESSYYGPLSRACHLDLVPYATTRKWTDLTTQQRSALLMVSSDTLALLLRDSPVRILILNGRSVVEHFQKLANVHLERKKMPAWSLPRHRTPDVPGVAYWGLVDTISGVALGQKLQILGFNHNLQSSFGVTTDVIDAIRDWVCKAVRGTIR